MVFTVKARAAGLRPRKRAYKVNCSHCCLLMRRLWLGRALGVDASGAARWLRFWFLPLLFLFLVSGVPAVLNFRQEFPNSFDALLTPSMHFQIAQLDGLRCRHFLLCDVATQSAGVDPQPLGSLSR